MFSTYIPPLCAKFLEKKGLQTVHCTAVRYYTPVFTYKVQTFGFTMLTVVHRYYTSNGLEVPMHPPSLTTY